MICIIRQLELLAYYGEINPLGEFLDEWVWVLLNWASFIISKFIMCVLCLVNHVSFFHEIRIKLMHFKL